MGRGPAAGTAVKTIILASASPTRAALLRSAGVALETCPAAIEEDAVKRSLLAAGADAASLAGALAEHKALDVARRRPDDLVIGADQVLECDGTIFDKPVDRDDAARQLRHLRGREHSQISAVCAVRGDRCVWRHSSRARLAMRRLGDDFLERYLETAGQAALSGPGAYELDGRGAQLFTRVDGDYFTVLGLPLLAVLEFLRQDGVLAT